MRLHEAIKKANDGNTCKIPAYNGFIIDKSNHKILTKEGEPFLFCPRDFERDDWQIIPAKKEMVSFDEWSKTKEFAPSRTETWRESSENRDLLYVDLMEGAKNACKANHTIAAIMILQNEIDKINAILNPKPLPTSFTATGH